MPFAEITFVQVRICLQLAKPPFPSFYDVYVAASVCVVRIGIPVEGTMDSIG